MRFTRYSWGFFHLHWTLQVINNAPGIIVTEGITGIRLAVAGSLTDSTSGALVAENSIALPKSSFVDAGCEEAPRTSLKKKWNYVQISKCKWKKYAFK